MKTVYAGFFLMGSLVASVIFSLVGWFAVYAGSSTWQRNAVEHGCAEWTMDPTTGATEWRWKEVQR